MPDNSWYEWAAFNKNPDVYKEAKISAGGYCREAMMDYVFDDSYKDGLCIMSDNLDRHMEKAEEYIKRWNKHFNQDAKIETIQLTIQKAARIVDNSISILCLIFYSLLRGDKEDYADGGLLDYCIKNNIKIEELESYEAHLIKDIFEADWNDDNYRDINGPIDYTEYFVEWREK